MTQQTVKGDGNAGRGKGGKKPCPSKQKGGLVLGQKRDLSHYSIWVFTPEPGVMTKSTTKSKSISVGSPKKAGRPWEQKIPKEKVKRKRAVFVRGLKSEGRQCAGVKKKSSKGITSAGGVQTLTRANPTTEAKVKVVRAVV